LPICYQGEPAKRHALGAFNPDVGLMSIIRRRTAWWLELSQSGQVVGAAAGVSGHLATIWDCRGVPAVTVLSSPHWAAGAVVTRKTENSKGRGCRLRMVNPASLSKVA
jgi:hypothetical protein